MKYLRRILIGLGMLFLGLIVLIGSLSWRSSQFLEANQDFAEQFARAFASTWRTEDVHELVTADFIETAATPNGQAFLSQLRTLGPLKSASDFQMGNYYSGTGGTTGEIKFKAIFSNAKAVVTVTVINKDGKTLVQAFNVQASDGASAQATEHEA